MGITDLLKVNGKDQGFTWPGYRYPGPGNPLPNGTPVNFVDQLPCEHDWAYRRARTEEEVREADRAAICGFAAELMTHGTYTAAIGLAGIGTKYIVESGVGVKYPNMSTRKYTVNGEGSIPHIQQMNRESERRLAQMEDMRAQEMRELQSYYNGLVQAGALEKRRGKALGMLASGCRRALGQPIENQLIQPQR